MSRTCPKVASLRKASPFLSLLVALVLLAACGTTASGPGAAVGTVGGGPSNAQGSPSQGATVPVDGATIQTGGGGDGGDGGGGGGGNGATAQALSDPCAKVAGKSDSGVTDTEIRIGLSGPLSGVTGFIGEEWAGSMDAYFQATNAKGGICGRKIKFIVYDDNLNPTQTLTNFRKLYDTDKVLAAGTSTGESIGDYVTRNKYPTFVFGVNSVAFESKFPTVYPVVGSSLIWNSVFAKAVKAWHPKEFPGMKVAILYDNKFLDTSALVPYYKLSYELLGAKVVSADALGPGDTDCTSLLLKMKQLGVQYWDFQSFGYIHCLAAAQRQNWRPAVGWGDWPPSAPLLLNQTGPIAGTVEGGAGSDQADGRPRKLTAEHVAYANAMKRYHPPLGNNPLHLNSATQTQGWVGGHLLVDALKAQGWVITRAGLNRWIQNIHNFDPVITFPIYSMAPHCKTGSEWVYAVKFAWDPQKRSVYWAKLGPYSTNTYFRDKYGPCWLTTLADKINAR